MNERLEPDETPANERDPGQELEPAPVTREQMLDDVPLTVTVWNAVDLDAEDPALDERGRRVCIAAKKAGGRCTVGAVRGRILCAVHAGLLDPSQGGHARAQKIRAAHETAEEKARWAALDSRGVIAAAFAERKGQLRSTIHVLLAAASQGDLQAAKLLGPYLNQAHGMPGERVEVVAPTGADDLSSMATGDLLALVRERRSQAVSEVPEPASPGLAPTG